MLNKCTGIFDRRFYLSAPNYQLNIFFKFFFILANFVIYFKIIIFSEGDMCFTTLEANIDPT